VPHAEHCAYERELYVGASDFGALEIGFEPVPWADFLLNPRRLRGSDFLMRWSQGVWSEGRIADAINATGEFRAVPYGPSGVAPDHDPRAHELYFERLEKAGLGKVKRPDLIVIRARDFNRAETTLQRLGGPQELPFTPESELQDLLGLAVAALECENSLWKAERMPAFNSPLRMQRRTGKPGLPKSAVAPTVILKEEDRQPLTNWQSASGVPIHIWHLFFDRAYGISLSQAETLISDGTVEATRQVFQAPGGATTTKIIYKINHHHAYDVGIASSEPRLIADCIEDKNGHILPFVRFEGSGLHLSRTAIEALRESTA